MRNEGQMKSIVTFISRWQNAAALALVSFYVLVAFAAPILAPLDAPGVLGRTRVLVGVAQTRGPRPPGEGIPLGTLPGDVDIVYGVVWGTRSALRVGLTIALCTALLGVILGALSGTIGGLLQEALMRGTDAFLAFPVIAGVVMFQLILSSPDSSISIQKVAGLFTTLHLTPVVLALICFSWMPYARLIDASIVQVKEMSYVHAARALGAGRFRIILRHLIPNAISPAFVFVARDVGASVILVAAFTFIGLGSESEWGTMLVRARDWIIGPGGNPLTYWWTYMPATAALLLFGVGWNLLGDGLHTHIILHTPRKAGRTWIEWVQVWWRSRWAPVAGALIVGLALGLTFGWAIQPVPPGGITPAQLRDEYREDYLRAVIGSYTAHRDPRLAVTRFQALGDLAEATLETVRSRPRNVTSASVREFVALISPFRRTAQGVGPSMEETGVVMAAVCAASLVAIVCLVVIILWARRSLRRPHGSRPIGGSTRAGRVKQRSQPP